MKIICCGSTESYLQIRELGYDGAELAARRLMELDAEKFDAFAALYRETGFPVVGFNSLCGPELPLVGPGQDLQALERYMRELCRRGAELQINSIGVGAPGARRPPEDWSSEDSDEQMRAFLRMACAVAEPYGISILLEAVHDGICGYLHLTSHAAALVADLHLPNLGMVLDYYQVRLMGEDPAALGFAMPWVRHLHVSGGERGEPRTFPVSTADAAEQRMLRACAEVQGYSGSTVSVEADARFLARDGAACLRLMKEAWNT